MCAMPICSEITPAQGCCKASAARREGSIGAAPPWPDSESPGQIGPVIGVKQPPPRHARNDAIDPERKPGGGRLWLRLGDVEHAFDKTL